MGGAIVTTHTPGPWAVEDARRVLGSTDYGRTVMRDAEVEANARLIAAAPDLLAALRAIVKLSDDLDPEGLFQSIEYINARAAIAKAEGALCGK